MNTPVIRANTCNTSIRSHVTFSLTHFSATPSNPLSHLRTFSPTLHPLTLRTYSPSVRTVGEPYCRNCYGQSTSSLTYLLIPYHLILSPAPYLSGEPYCRNCYPQPHLPTHLLTPYLLTLSPPHLLTHSSALRRTLLSELLRSISRQDCF